MASRGREKMDEDTETKDQFVIPSPPVRDSKASFGAIRSKHGHQTTSTPYIGAFQGYICANSKRHCGSDPTLNCYTPISRTPHDIKYCGHQSFDTLSDVETHADEPHTQLNLLSHFEGRAEEFLSVRDVELGGSSVWGDRHPAEKRRSLQMDKSPSPYRNKRHSLDLSGDSGCFSTQTTRSDSHFSSEMPHLPFGLPVMEETFPGPVCLAGEQSTRSLTSNSAGSFSEKYFASGEPQSAFANIDLSRHSSDSFHSNLTPSIGEKVSKLQLVLTFDSGYSVASMDTSVETTRNVRSNATPLFGEKLLKSNEETSSLSACDIHLTPNLPFGKRIPSLPGDMGCTIEMSDKSAHGFNSNSTLSFNEKVSKLQPSDSEHGVDIDPSSSSPSKSPRTFDNVLDLQSTVTCESCLSVDCADIGNQSDLLLAKVALYPQDFTTSVEKPSLKLTYESEVGCDIPHATKWLRSQTFEERLALRKMILDQEIGLRIGRKYVDVVRELSRKMCTEALAKIFGYLSEDELCSLCLVSRQWKSAVELETNTRLRRRKYIQDNRQRIAGTPQENRSKLLNPTRQQNFTNPNKPMAEIQTMEELPLARPIVPMLTKAEEFLREARSLDRTESLRKCPKCDSPARANEKDRRARCTKCRYEFCVSCRKLLHGGSDCVLHVRNPAPAKIGSKQSKQNLRRL